jgi:ferredoxin
MATVITEECINCGACEPECPNTAIYQGGVEWELDGVKHPAISNAIFYIVPDKCTECVGFYDHEACAAVCPVDCCIPDPKIPETEDVLIARARKLHPDQDFGAAFPSRFRKEDGEAPAAAPKPPAPASAAAPAVAPAAPADVPVAARSDVSTLSIPPLEEWEVPLSCSRCDGEYTVPFQYFRPGVVFYCPHCTASFVPNIPIYDRISRLLRTFHDGWTRSFEEFHDRRQRELETFEKKQRELLGGFQQELKNISHDLQPAGARPKRRSMFG